MTVQELYEFAEKFVKAESGSGEVLAPVKKADAAEKENQID